jgi:hypothetical protein
MPPAETPASEANMPRILGGGLAILLNRLLVRILVAAVGILKSDGGSASAVMSALVF